MALLKIAKLGNPVLRQVAKPIELNELVNPDSGLQEFIDDMIETMHHEGGGWTCGSSGKSLHSNCSAGIRRK